MSKLICHVIDKQVVNIRSAPLSREWMDKTPQKFAYRCLPLNIANQHGWEILLNEPIFASWNGGPDLTDLKVQGTQACSHFGSGILTFHIGAIFTTEPGYQLFVTGPTNNPAPLCVPLSGVVETDWAPYTFTMNWKFTEPGQVHFAKGEPFCLVFPVSCDYIEAVEPEIRPLSSNPKLKEEYDTWAESRGKFIVGLNTEGSEAREQKWQKNYYRGLDPTGKTKDLVKHRTKLKLRDFKG